MRIESKLHNSNKLTLTFIYFTLNTTYNRKCSTCELFVVGLGGLGPMLPVQFLLFSSLDLGTDIRIVLSIFS